MRKESLDLIQLRFIRRNKFRLTRNEIADALACSYGCVAYAIRKYGFEGIKEKRRWTPEEESALLDGKKLDRNDSSMSAKRWRLAGGKKPISDRKKRMVQVTNWLGLQELELIKNGFDEKGISVVVREKNGAYAIFRDIKKI